MIKKHFRKLKRQAGAQISEKAAGLQNLNPLTPPKPAEPITLDNVPQITTEKVAEHREEVLKGARKYIYPLAHSKHRIILITTSIFIGAVILFGVYCTLALYRWYDYNAFLYRVTQVVPFPIAKAGGSFVDYENYLFEVRRYVHYYETQQQQDLKNNGRGQLLEFRKKALGDVVKKAEIKQLAQTNKVGVSDKEVEQRIAIVREQNRLGGSNKVFADVLRDYWGWNAADFKRSLGEEMLSEKVVAKLDTDASAKAQSALGQLSAGHEFGDLAKNVSEDPASKAAGGDYGFSIGKTNRNIPPQVIDALFKLKPGQVSGIINTGSTLEIVRVNQATADGVTAQHIVFGLKDINTFIKPLADKQKTHNYVKF